MTELVQFEVFMKNYQDMVYSTALRLLGNETEAQDITQTVFLKAYASFAQIGSSPTAGGWLKTVATNLCLNHLTRYRARWKMFSDLRDGGDTREFIDSLEASTSEAEVYPSEFVERAELLEAALRRLPDSQRVPLVLYHFEDLPYEAISRKLGVSLSKIKTDIHRGRLALRRFLEARSAARGQHTAGTACGPATH